MSKAKIQNLLLSLRRALFDGTWKTETPKEKILAALATEDIYIIKAALAKVKELNLSYSQLTPKQVQFLAEALRTNTTLIQLDLTGNKVGDGGATFIGEALKINSTLIYLNLLNNGIGATGATALGKGIKINSTLKQLNLCGNEIRDNGATAFGEGLRINATLKKLNFVNNKIGDEGTIALEEALKTNTTLKKLELWGNRIGAEGLTAIKGSIARNNELTTYMLWFNAVHQAAIDSVKDSNRGITEVGKILFQHQLSIQENPAPDLFRVEDNKDISKYITSNYFWLIGVCKVIDKANPLSLLVVAPDCMAHMLSFLEPTSLFPKLLPRAELLSDEEVKSKTELIGEVGS
jgi:hypothetical protein